MKKVYMTLAAIAMSVFAYAPEQAQSAKPKDSDLDKMIMKFQVQNSDPSNDILNFISQCKDYKTLLNTRMEELRKIEGKISEYNNQISSFEKWTKPNHSTNISDFDEYASFGSVLTSLERLIVEIKSDKNSRYNSVEARANQVLQKIINAEQDMLAEEKTVLGFMDWFEEIKKLTSTKDYFIAKDMIISLMNDIEKFKPQYEPIIVKKNNNDRSNIVLFRGESYNNMIIPKEDRIPKEYKGKAYLQKQVSEYHKNTLQSKLAKHTRVVARFFIESESYAAYLNNEDIDRLLASDDRLDSLTQIINVKPYSGHQHFCSEVTTHSGKIQTALENIARKMILEYRDNITEMEQKLKSENISPKEGNRLMAELDGYIALFEKYQNSLFSKEFVKDEKIR